MVIVAVAVGKGAAVGDHAMVEQRAITFLHGLELVQQIGELLDVIAVDLRDLFDLLPIAAVMRQAVMGFRATQDIYLGRPPFMSDVEAGQSGPVNG